MKKSTTIQIIQETDFRIKKHLGQNFLVDDNILDKIVREAKISSNTCVIEIGPGIGSLTGKLLEVAKKVLAYEVDKELIPILTKAFQDSPNITFINQDILKVGIDEDINQHFPNEDEIVVVANLPYYITTPILMKFLEESKRVKKLILMMQLEVARRITSKPDSKDYNALTIAIGYRAQAEILFKVPKTVFMPMPGVDSAIVEIKVKNQPDFPAKDEKAFFAFVHHAFSQRRKTLINNLLAHYPKGTRQDFEELLRRNNLEVAIRAEAVDIQTFVNLANDFGSTLNISTNPE